MDLIYVNPNGIEIGMIQDFTFDTAFGKDENDFSLTLDINDHCCDKNYSIFIENTELGGKIDKILVDTASNNVTYEGRTWHGLIENKVIEPDKGQDYKIVSGEANSVLAGIINDIGLADMFTVSTAKSGITVAKYQFERYCKAYTGILDMLYAYRGKLSFSYEQGHVMLSAVPLYDYSNDEEWDSSQFDFSIKKNYRPVNHLICLGAGDLKYRNVIHLFTDANGGIRPYLKKSIPQSDTDYILDKSQQLLFGVNEVTDTYDYGNAAVTENYVLCTVQPSNWSRVYTDYYYKSGDKYIQNDKEYITEHTNLTVKPTDWDKNCGSYFEKNGNNFKNVAGENVTTYNLLDAKPSDWNTQYKSYFYCYSDGTTKEYRSISADKRTEYVQQTMQPSDWSTNFSNYYYIVSIFEYEYLIKRQADNGIWDAWVQRSAVPMTEYRGRDRECKLNKKIVVSWNYEKVSGSEAPVWKPDTYYTSKSIDVAPAWKDGEYYTVVNSVTAPAWVSGKYYRAETVEVIPSWTNGKYYQLYIDNFAELVSGGLKRLGELNNSDSLGISFDASQEYDINDIVGAKENITGISVSKKITKKIVKIKNGTTEINYEIGE